MINWQKPGRRLILASGSPRRKQILEMMGFTFDVLIPDGIDEKALLDDKKLDYSLQSLAAKKAQAIAVEHPDALVLGADTVVVKDSQVLGKPVDDQDAYRMIKLLSGSSHVVMTGVALICNDLNFCKTLVIYTKVFFRTLSENEICKYINDSSEYMDKAGAYAIQGNALIFIEKIEGCYYNVVGLPVSGTIDLFKEFIVRKESADV